MEVKERKPKNLGVLMIGFSPVVREGLQAILTKDEGIEVIEDAQDGTEALLQIKQFTVHGEPKDLTGAMELANQDKYQFQWWAVAHVGGQPYGERKKGADSGIDGYLYYMDEKDKIKKAIVSVKGGHNANVSMIRDLGHVIEREKSDIGIFISIDKPTRPMVEEAAMKGFYHSPFIRRDFPRLQILTIEEILNGKMPEIPPWIAPVPAASASKKKDQGPKLF